MLRVIASVWLSRYPTYNVGMSAVYWNVILEPSWDPPNVAPAI